MNTSIHLIKTLILSSGIPVNDNVAEEILNVITNGTSSFESFSSERLTSNKKDFMVELACLKIQLFSGTGKKVEVVVNGKEKTVEANSNVISRLLALSIHFDRKIDMQYSNTNIGLGKIKIKIFNHLFVC